jgi:hypothetical protein
VGDNITAIKKLSLGIIMAIAIAGLILTVASAGVLNSSQTLHTQGTLTQVQTTVNIGVYSDSLCTQLTSFLDWGALTPGGSTTRTVWIKNVGSANAALTMTTGDWTPANVNQWLTLYWNKENTVLVPNGITQTTLTLTVSPTIDGSITSFALNIQITGTGS